MTKQLLENAIFAKRHNGQLPTIRRLYLAVLSERDNRTWLAKLWAWAWFA